MPKTIALPVVPSSAGGTPIPAYVRIRLEDPEGVTFYREAGPVSSQSAATLRLELAERAAQAVVHGQHDLAQALIDAVVACEALPGRAAA